MSAPQRYHRRNQSLNIAKMFFSLSIYNSIFNITDFNDVLREQEFLKTEFISLYSN